MIEPGLVSGMIDYIAMAVLAMHRNLVAYVSQQRQRAWKLLPVILAEDLRVGIVGPGMLGEAACTRTLAQRSSLVGTSQRLNHPPYRE